MKTMEKRKKKKINKGNLLFDIFNFCIMLLVIGVTLFPILHVLAASLSSPTAVSEGKVSLWPVDLTLYSYKTVFSMDNIWTSYGNTVFYSFVGTALSMILTILGAYPLSKKRLRGRTFISFMVAFTMWFGAGMMPTYLNFRNFGLLDTRLSILLFSAVSAFNMLLLRTYFESIPDSIEESAKIDGASDFRILFTMFLPLSKAALMTVSMYYLIGRWNAYFWASILIRDEAKVPLQVLLRKLVVEMNQTAELGNMDYSKSSRETITYAIMIVATLPMLVVYPYVQKFFVKGVVVGAVKG